MYQVYVKVCMHQVYVNVSSIWKHKTITLSHSRTYLGILLNVIIILVLAGWLVVWRVSGCLLKLAFSCLQFAILYVHAEPGVDVSVARSGTEETR